MTTADPFVHRQADRLASLEAARVARFARLSAALTAVREHDDDVLDADDSAALNQAQATVDDIREAW